MFTYRLFNFVSALLSQSSSSITHQMLPVASRDKVGGIDLNDIDVGVGDDFVALVDVGLDFSNFYGFSFEPQGLKELRTAADFFKN